MKATDIAVIRRAVRSVAKKHPVELVYLFGSRSMGKEDSESDIDLAFLVKDSLSKDRRNNLRVKLFTEIAQALGVDDSMVDIVMLQDASVLLQYNAVSAGSPLFQKTRLQRALYEVGVYGRYDDERYYLERDNEITLQKLLSSRSQR